MKGIEIGVTKGLKEGRKEGKKEGRKEGKKEGRKEGIYSVARAMKEKGLSLSLDFSHITVCVKIGFVC